MTTSSMKYSTIVKPSADRLRHASRKSNDQYADNNFFRKRNNSESTCRKIPVVLLGIKRFLLFCS